MGLFVESQLGLWLVVRITSGKSALGEVLGFSSDKREEMCFLG